jgi:hypothetical protein
MGDGTTVGNYFVDDIAVTAPTQIEEPLNELAFTFGPNPAVNFINLKGQPDQAWVRIHALNGQLVHEELVTNMSRGQVIEFNLNEGIYFLEVNAGNQRSTQRLVVHH